MCCNWKDAIAAVRKDEELKTCHEALEASCTITLPKTALDVDELLSSVTRRKGVCKGHAQNHSIKYRIPCKARACSMRW